jgi:hydroxymethylpyrimidine pyrophosphatase-like HAD family hydrolase
MVIGDGSNDLSMFQAFPTHAAAMANGVREIREAAGFITASNDEDGVARAIERALA